VNAQIQFTTGTIATITASRATEQKIRTLEITQPEAYIVLDYADQDIRIHRRAAQDYVVNRESIRYRQASFVEHLFVHKENPLKLEIQNLIRAAQRAAETGSVELTEADDLRSLGVALEIERMIREGHGEVIWPQDLPWSVPSA
jgi:predicted dehydrogenase